MSRLAAVILAAGAGTRLGGVAKALLPAAPGTFLDRVVGTARAAGTEQILVVVGPPFGAEVAARAGTLGAVVVENPAPGRGMASSVALGFAALLATECELAWLWPVDHPDVAVATLRALVAAIGEHDAARPTVNGRGGHPPLVARRLWARLAACGELPHGARAVLAGAATVDVEVRDPGTVRDVDTPEQLA